jgi:hypothetical protein
VPATVARRPARRKFSPANSFPVRDDRYESLKGQERRGLPVASVAFGASIARAWMPMQQTQLVKLSSETVKEDKSTGEPITAKLTRTSGNNAPIGGLKVVSADGWFAARPSGTGNLYKVFAKCFTDQAHLDAVVAEAQQIVSNTLAGK